MHTKQKSKTNVLVECDKEILNCVKKTLHGYGGRTPDPFLYDFRSKTMLRDRDIPNKPLELEECLDHIFDGASIIVKKAMIDEVKTNFGLKQDCRNLKEAFKFARKTSGRVVKSIDS